MDIRALLVSEVGPLLAWLLTSGARVLIILLVAALLLRTTRLLTAHLGRALTGFVQQSAERQKRTQTLTQIVQTTASTVLLIVTAMLILGEIGIDLTPLIAAAGIGGLAIGFGAQNLVRDVISGFFLLLEDQVRVGDIIKIGDKSGQVEHIGLRIITLRDFDASVHVIPNGTITTVTNFTKEFSYAVLDIGVPYHANVDTVFSLLKEVGTALRHDPDFTLDLLDDVEVVGVSDFTESRMKITLRVKTVPTRQWRVARELRRRIKMAFDAHDLKFV
jgi:small conductance mechanosensitive channel